MSIKTKGTVGLFIVLSLILSSDSSKKNEVNPLTEILKCPTKVVLLRVSGVEQNVFV